MRHPRIPGGCPPATPIRNREEFPGPQSHTSLKIRLPLTDEEWWRKTAWRQAPAEYETKAAFLYNLAKFVEWPPVRAGLKISSKLLSFAKIVASEGPRGKG